MKLVTFAQAGRTSFGIWRDDGVVDLGRRMSDRFGSLAAMIADGGIDAARTYQAEAADLAHDSIQLLKPLGVFGKCFCVGVNYPDRNAEYKDASDLPMYPSLFARFPSSLTGPDMPLTRPPESQQLDYEGEVVLVVGKAGRRIPAARWTEHVAGWTVGNEGTIRDWVRHGKFNVTPGKNWSQSGSIGPWLVTADEAGTGPFHVTTRVNGQVRQDDSTERMMFPFGRLLEYISTFCPLEPGDLVFTGTPTGSGARLDPPAFLVPGDLVEIEVSGVGLLRNTIADEQRE